MDGGEGGYLSRRTHSGICGRSTTGTRSRRGDVPARRRGGGELSHGAESAPVGATCIRHGRTILDAVQLKNLPGDVSYSEAGISVRNTKQLWDMPVVFLLLLGLPITEW